MVMHWLPLGLVGGAAAQVLTAFPHINHAAIVAAVNPNDEGFQACSAADEHLSLCMGEFGGPQGLQTASPADIAGCVCCAGTVQVSPVLSVCATYLSDEAPTLTAQASAYDTLYDLCKSAPRACAGGGGGGSGGSGGRGGGGGSGSDITSASGGLSVSLSESANPSRTLPSITASAATTVASACVSMVGYFQSCTRNVARFTDLPLSEQAECYCCATSSGKVTWTDALGTQASSCATWASTGNTDTILPVASTFAQFCSKYRDACGASATETGSSSGATATADSGDKTAGGNNAAGTTNNNGNAGQVTVTVTPTATKSAASTIASFSLGGVLVIIAIAVML